MTFRRVTPLEFARMQELASKPYRPPQIVQLKERIENETKAAELRASITGEIDPETVQRIVAMRLELDLLYDEWTTGEIE